MRIPSRSGPRGGHPPSEILGVAHRSDHGGLRTTHSEVREEIHQSAVATDLDRCISVLTDRIDRSARLLVDEGGQLLAVLSGPRLLVTALVSSIGGNGFSRVAALGDVLDEVELSLLAAATHEIQLYEISKWGENVGVASTVTFSRTKDRLEDQGMIATEKVPIDVGRPRLRLQLGDDQLRNVEASDLPAAAQEMLASAPA